ncbi:MULTISPECIES: hypothetical protein [unclassified Mesorhizobium]|uniref:hypothetical protein n=1 Tax=unclassified Mesorhizobium TaxID=325217 RepID=UPI001129B64B|nr:hypothetical protein [Mesorhizobium sp. B2-2-3]TPM39366.1 hypothetical protein FJ951_27040 [Mesorhizobium sp. B2-2-3]
MTLHDIHDIAEIFGAIGALIGAVGTIALTWLVFRFSQKQEAQKSTEDVQNWWQTHNSVVLSNPRLLSLEKRLHPFGDLTDEEVRRLYIHFMTLNVCYNAWANRDQIDRSLSESTIDNSVNRLFLDRDFVVQHVLPRGYPKDFAEEILRRLGLRESTAKPLPMS